MTKNPIRKLIFPLALDDVQQTKVLFSIFPKAYWYKRNLAPYIYFDGSGKKSCWSTLFSFQQIWRFSMLLTTCNGICINYYSSISQYKNSRNKKLHIRPSLHLQKKCKISYHREHRCTRTNQHHGEKDIRHPLRDATKSRQRVWRSRKDRWS